MKSVEEARIGADGGERVFEAAGLEAEAAEEVGEDGILEGLDVGMDVGLVVEPKEQAGAADEEGEDGGERGQEASEDWPRGRVAGRRRQDVAGWVHYERNRIIGWKAGMAKGKRGERKWVVP